ncbi:M1 family metallopeptidase [Pseudalkalibacillus sp. SCS-8]|uniref:M1 family metallopeptidase n=1 Tax=Pseudalkalibacillus nanhaiensis TaxID=3115291 RepID=UPI0032D9EE9E
MEKKRIFMGLFLVVLLGIGTFFVITQPQLRSVFGLPPKLDEVNTAYKVDVKVAPHTKSAQVSMTIHTKNDTGKVQDRIYFQVLANKLKDLKPLKGEAWERYLGDSPLPGGLDFKEVTVNGEKADYSMKDTMMEIPLEENWELDERIKVEMTFDVSVPRTDGIFSYNEGNIYFAGWLPTRAIFNDGEWYMSEFIPIGDTSYNDPANYDVTITVPKSYQIASTGSERKDPEIEGRNKTFYVKAEKVREFMMSVLNRTYEHSNDEINGIKIKSWYTHRTKFGHKIYHYNVKNVLRYFSEKYGEYPYDEFEIVPGYKTLIGMEFPGLTMVKTEYYGSGAGFFHTTITHEIAHQWWYGVVGNNTFEDPWLDESLATYTTMQYMKEEFPYVIDESIDFYLEKTSEFEELTKEGHSITSSTKDFMDSNRDKYGPLIYAVATNMFYQLEQEIGVDKMNEALRDYYQKNKFGQGTREELIESFKTVIGPEAEEYFSKWLDDKQPVKLADIS